MDWVTLRSRGKELVRKYRYVLLVVLAGLFLMALPEGEASRRLRKAIWALPVLMFTAVFSHIKRFFHKKR